MYHRRQVRRASRANDESHRISQKSSFLPESTPVRNFSFDQIALHPPFSDVQPYGNTSPASADHAHESSEITHRVRSAVQNASPRAHSAVHRAALSVNSNDVAAQRVDGVSDDRVSSLADEDQRFELKDPNDSLPRPGHRFEQMRLYDDDDADRHLSPGLKATPHVHSQAFLQLSSFISPVIAQPSPGSYLQRTPAEDVIAAHTTLLNLREDRLGAELLRRMRGGEYSFIIEVFDALGSTDRDDVAYEMMTRASETDLGRTVQSADGRRLLDRLFDELTAGNVSPEEQEQANRIVRAKAGRIGVEQFEQGMRTAKIFPFRLPGLTVLNDAPISAERRERGRIWVKQPVRVLGTSMFREEMRTLPADVFIAGIELPEDEIVGVRMYDMGGVIIYRPALFLIQLSNTTDTTVLTKMIEIAGIGVTLGTGALASAGAEASLAARAFLWADRIAFALGTIASVIAEHRGWIIRRFGASGQRFLRHVEMLQSALYVYNIVSIVRNTPRLVRGLRSSFDEWSAAVRGVERELSATELQTVRTISDETETILQQCAAIAQASSGPPQSGSLSDVERDVDLGSTPSPPQRR